MGLDFAIHISFSTVWHLLKPQNNNYLNKSLFILKKYLSYDLWGLDFDTQIFVFVENAPFKAPEWQLFKQVTFYFKKSLLLTPTIIFFTTYGGPVSSFNKKLAASAFFLQKLTF